MSYDSSSLLILLICKKYSKAGGRGYFILFSWKERSTEFNKEEVWYWILDYFKSQS